MLRHAFVTLAGRKILQKILAPTSLLCLSLCLLELNDCLPARAKIKVTNAWRIIFLSLLNFKSNLNRYSRRMSRYYQVVPPRWGLESSVLFTINKQDFYLYLSTCLSYVSVNLQCPAVQNGASSVCLFPLPFYLFKTNYLLNYLFYPVEKSQEIVAQALKQVLNRFCYVIDPESGYQKLLCLLLVGRTDVTVLFCLRVVVHINKDQISGLSSGKFLVGNFWQELFCCELF